MMSFKLFIVTLIILQYQFLVNCENSKPYETQRAQCTVTTGDVQASAEAIMSKTLEGVCGSKELQSLISNLEAKLVAEIHEIKTLVKEIIRNDYAHSQNKKLEHGGAKITIGNNVSVKSITKINNSDENEVDKFRDVGTFAKTETNFFSYNWKLENVSNKLPTNSFEVSPAFNILGRNMRLRANFKHLHRSFVFIQLELVSSDYEQTYKNIVLNSGNLFKEVQENILFKYKISILHQANPDNDLVSHEFVNIGNGFLIPNNALLSSSYSKNNTILIKLLIYV